MELIAAGKAKDYAAARAIHDRLLPVTKNVYHRGSHMEGTVALKEGLVARGILEHATVRPPLLPLAEGAGDEIARALKSANLAVSPFPPDPRRSQGWRAKRPPSFPPKLYPLQSWSTTTPSTAAGEGGLAKCAS
ncbi:4-hydroxy-tetrahydrodipicolinate synthase [Arthrobacter sp. Hiyo8]|nr:4-hydroxy-tetrahydrodipicolinate synthase [Arthrobacter sp. Hiyo8]